MVTVPNGLIVGWDNIARDLGVNKRTAQRWEDQLNLPIKRCGKVVYAEPSEMFDWKVKENNRRRKMKAQKRRKNVAV